LGEIYKLYVDGQEKTMPALMECPTCDFPGPLGFNSPVPWGIHFYHAGCKGGWFYNGVMYEEEKGAYKQWKKDDPPDPDWELAYDAKIFAGDMVAYHRYIKLWHSKWECR
jgi:hypothetical protein